MNFFYFSLIVILCFGPWATAGEIYSRITKNSAGATLETKSRKSNAESNFSVINGLIQVASQAKTWAQWLRRLLKSLRKWCSVHPLEVKLAKCLASYFNIKTPGPRRHDQIERPKETKQSKLRGDCFGEKKSLQAPSWAFLEHIKGRFKKYRDVIFGNELVVCFWDYFWKKFWIWVDAAPDSRCQV